jgi:hypothetical protein
VRRIGLVVALVAAIGFAGVAQTLVAPRVVEGGVLLFDNTTGAPTTKVGISFSVAGVTLAPQDIIAFGGSLATNVVITTTFCWIEVVVDAGGTLQVTLPAEYAGAVTAAFWFE